MLTHIHEYGILLLRIASEELKSGVVFSADHAKSAGLRARADKGCLVRFVSGMEPPFAFLRSARRAVSNPAGLD